MAADGIEILSGFFWLTNHILTTLAVEEKRNILKQSGPPQHLLNIYHCHSLWTDLGNRKRLWPWCVFFIWHGRRY